MAFVALFGSAYDESSLFNGMTGNMVAVLDRLPRSGGVVTPSPVRRGITAANLSTDFVPPATGGGTTSHAIG